VKYFAGMRIDFYTMIRYGCVPMSLTASEVLKRLLDRARQDIPEQTFRTWLEPTEALSIDGNIISIGVPDQFAADWN